MSARTLSQRVDALEAGIARIEALLSTSKAAEPVKPITTRAEGIEAARTHRCTSCGWMYTKAGLETHKANRKASPKPCSQWNRKAR